MSGKGLKTLGEYWGAVWLPVVLTVAWIFLMAVLLRQFANYEGEIKTAAWVVWYVVPLYVGWRVASTYRGTVLKGALAGGLYGLVAAALYYGLALASSALGLFGTPIEWAFINAWELAQNIGVQVGMSAVRSAAITAAATLLGLFVITVKEAE
ncbi:Uncharacterised protein [Candidatus Burarchaeum australiense]|nr:Uncharacterised protein [Candidatus Burarchaeum australiense]